MTSTGVEMVAALERANYCSMQSLVAVTPGSRLVLRDDVILTSARLFPMADMNHACLLRTDADRAEALISEIVHYFRKRLLPVNVCLSPACSPPDLPERLAKRGFRRQENEEAWLAYSFPPGWEPPPLASEQVLSQRVGEGDAAGFARIYLASFGLPGILAPVAALLLRRSLRLPNMRYYVAYVEGRPAGICLWHAHGDIACLGAVGVLPAHRRSKVATTIVVQAGTEAQQQGMRLLMTQTLYPGLAEVLREHGFEQVFTRTYYAL